MNAHTPGPWITNRHHADDQGRSIGTAKGAICLLVTDGGFTASEQTANAALIASAPDLARRCEGLLRLLAGMREHFGDKWPVDLDNNEAFAIAALKKAGVR